MILIMFIFKDTFIKIEAIVKENARILALKDKPTVKNYKCVVANHKNVRILLGFMEALEKAIYNASDGNAFGIPPAEKPARTFFRLNAPTCSEWLNRNRTAINLIGLHSMELEMVIRYSESVLKDLVASKKTSEQYFEHILMSLVWALLRNFESDALNGLYVWAKNVTGKKYLWIKMSAEQAAGHREAAADGYIKITTEETFTDPHIFEFIDDQKKMCMYYDAMLAELYDLLLKQEQENLNRVTIPILPINSTQIKCVMMYEETRDPNVLNMASWEMLETGYEVPNTLSAHELSILSVNTFAVGLITKNSVTMQNLQTSFETLQVIY